MAHTYRPPASKVRDVWASNFNVEMLSLVAAASAVGPTGFLALDTEFPGVLRQAPVFAAREAQYRAMRANVNIMRPIQVGAAIATASGEVLGSWSFNLRFDVLEDHHSEAAITLLAAAGIDFPRHATEGIDPTSFGEALAASPMVDTAEGPLLITFNGQHDLGYLVRLLTQQALPSNLDMFDIVLSFLCPSRFELRDWLRHGSLNILAQHYGVCRQGAAHTAGSDALVTLELFLCTRTAFVEPPESMPFGKLQGEQIPGDLAPFGAQVLLRRRVETIEAALARADALVLRLREASGSGGHNPPAPAAKSAWGAAAQWASLLARRGQESATVPPALWAAAAREEAAAGAAAEGFSLRLAGSSAVARVRLAAQS